MIPWMALHGSPSGRSFNSREHVVEPADLLLGLRAMRLERLLQLSRLRCLRHFGQGLQDLVLGEVDVLQGVKEKPLQVLLGHDQLQ